MQVLPHHYLKQYPCLTHRPSSSPPTVLHLHHYPYPTPSSLPHAILDTLTSSLHLLHWIHSPHSHILTLTSFPPSHSTTLTMTSLPLSVTVSGGRLFLVGGRQVVIVELEGEDGNARRQKVLGLEESEIVDVVGCYTSSGEAGVSVCYYSHKMGYYSREYSWSSENSLWGMIKAQVQFNLKLNLSYDHFSTILPNILAVVVHRGEASLYDFHTGSIALCPPIPFPFKADKPYVRVRWQLARPNPQYHDTLQIMLQVDNELRMVVLNVKRKQFSVTIARQTVEEFIPIDQLIKGDIIDWEGSTFQPTAFEWNSPLPIVDYLLTEHSVWVWTLGSQLSEIPTLHNISLRSPNSPTRVHILTEEGAVWRDYFTLQHPASNSLFPYRPFLLRSPPTAPLLPSEGKRTLQQREQSVRGMSEWRQQHRFMHLLQYKGEVYLVRRGSVGCLHRIGAGQYELEQYSEEDKRKDEEDKKKGWEREMKYGGYLHLWQGARGVAEKVEEGIQWVKQRAQLCLNHQSQPMPEQMVVEAVRNVFVSQVCYYSSLFAYANMQKQLVFLSSKNRLIYRIITHLHSVLHTPAHHITVRNLLDSIISQSHPKGITTGVQALYQGVFTSILPDLYTLSPHNHNNPYLQALIQHFLQHKDNQQIQGNTQQIIKAYIIQVLSEEEIRSSYMLQVPSVVKAYLISQPSQQQLTLFFRALIQQPNYQLLLRPCRDILHLVPQPLEILYYCVNQQQSSQTPQSTLAVAKQLFYEELFVENPMNQFEAFLGQLTALIAQLQQLKPYAALRLHAEIQADYQKQVERDAYSQLGQNILETQLTMLQGYTQLFNSLYPQLRQQALQQQAQFRRLLSVVLLQIENSLRRYKKWFGLVYIGQKQVAFRVNCQTRYTSLMEEISSDQQIMSNQFLPQPIRLLGTVSSQALARVYRLMLSDPVAKTEIELSPVLSISSEGGQRVLARLLRECEECGMEEIDMLHYVLMKRGTHQLRRILDMTEYKARKIQQYFERRPQEEGILYQIVGESLGQGGSTGYQRLKSQLYSKMVV